MSLPTLGPDELDAALTLLKDEYENASLWKLWCQGPLQRYYILHWSLDPSAEVAKEVKAFARFLQP